MQTSATFDALVALATRRVEVIAERDEIARTEGYGAAWAMACGTVMGLTLALDALKEAGEHVASAEYVAAGGVLVGTHGA
jgi:hypothetical protein